MADAWKLLTVRGVGVAAVMASLAGAAAAQDRVRLPSPYPDHTLFQAADDTERACQLPPQEFDDRSLWNANLWPGGVVWYTVDPNVTTTNADRLRIAMYEIETVCGVRFNPRSNQVNYINVRDSSGNSSSVGMIGGLQNVNLFNWSFRYIVIHELMHALGIFHEQQRSDRDPFVVINQANIQTAYFNANFPKNGATPSGGYDFESIMHYDACAFSTCCPAGSTCSCGSGCYSITAQPAYAAFQNVMGNRGYLSQGDKDGLVSRYGVSPDDPYAPNFTLATARELVSTQSIIGRLNTTSDWYKIVLPTALTLSVTTIGDVWAPSNATVRIKNAAGTTLTSSSFVKVGTTISANPSRALPAGTYYIEVNRTQPFGGPYVLTVKASCKPADFNGDSLVNDADFSIFSVAYDLLVCSDPAMPAGCPADITKDGFVDDADFAFFLSGYNTLVCP
ncbi:MAG: hypothetical protein K2Y21_02025 [Phycisphaerales bacterium]|nr:hypothetical protein [Phycisphaerales bacterium]